MHWLPCACVVEDWDVEESSIWLLQLVKTWTGGGVALLMQWYFDLHTPYLSQWLTSHPRQDMCWHVIRTTAPKKQPSSLNGRAFTAHNACLCGHTADFGVVVRFFWFQVRFLWEKEAALLLLTPAWVARQCAVGAVGVRQMKPQHPSKPAFSCATALAVAECGCMPT